MFRKRVMTALIGVPFFLYVLYHGGLPLVVTTAALAVITAYEFTTMLAKVDIVVDPFILYPGALLLPVLVCRVGLSIVFAAVPAAFLLSVLFTVSQVVIGSPTSHAALANRIAWTVVGAAYVAVLWSLLPLLRSLGFRWVLLAVAVTWFTDTGAYLAGHALGGPKLVPGLSPNKTWSGVVGGTLAGTAGSLLVNSIWPFAGLIPAVGTGLAAAGSAQTGDLWISLLKRFVGVKDAGHLLPGHGGILDRFDSFLFVLPVIYLFAFYIY